MRVIVTLTALAGLCGPIPDGHPVIQRSCLVTPPPAVRSWSVVDDGCPADLVCLSDADAREIAAEVEERRAWDRAAWRLCGPRSATPPVE